MRRLAAILTPMLCAAPAQADIIIDDFSSGVYGSGFVTTPTFAAQVGTMIGNARDTEVSPFSGTAELRIAAGEARCFSTANSFSDFNLIYDGLPNSSDDDNVISVDFSGENAFRVEFAPLSNGPVRSQIIISDTLGTNRIGPINVLDVTGGGNLDVPFSSFPGIDFSRIDRIFLQIENNNPADTLIVADTFKAVTICDPTSDLMIDDFTSGSYNSGIVSTTTDASQLGTMLGGSRDTQVDLVSGTAVMSILAGTARCSSDASSFSDFEFVYDGRANTLDDDNLIGVNLSCKNVVRLTFGPGTTGPVRSQMFLSDTSGNNDFGPVLTKDVTGGGTFDHPLCAFGTIDLENVDRIYVQIENNNPAPTTFFLDSISATVEPCPADVNKDGLADPADFTAWLACFNNPASAPYCPRADVNGDGNVDPADFTAWLAAFNAGCV